MKNLFALVAVLLLVATSAFAQTNSNGQPLGWQSAGQVAPTYNETRLAQAMDRIQPKVVVRHVTTKVEYTPTEAQIRQQMTTEFQAKMSFYGLIAIAFLLVIFLLNVLLNVLFGGQTWFARREPVMAPPAGPRQPERLVIEITGQVGHFHNHSDTEVKHHLSPEMEVALKAILDGQAKK